MQPVFPGFCLALCCTFMYVNFNSSIQWFTVHSDVFLCVIFILWSSLPCCVCTMFFDICSVKINVKVFAWSKGAVVIGWDCSRLVLCNSLLMLPKLHFIKIWQSSVVLKNWSTVRQGQFWMFQTCSGHMCRQIKLAYTVCFSHACRTVNLVNLNHVGYN